MATQTLNEALIAAMQNKISDGTRLANVLIDILFIGKEAVYRRLRGEVPFTLNEAAIIARELGISLDNTVGTKTTDNALFDLSMIDTAEPIKAYEKVIKQYCQIYRSFKDLDNTELGLAANLIPQVFYLKYATLSKFRLFKWIYQNDKTNTYSTFSDLIIPDHIRDLQKEYVRETQFIKTTIYILDNQIFNSFVNDVRYFINIHLIKQEEVEQIKEDLIHLLGDLEEYATKGKFKSGNNLQVYISNVNFEATYTYVSTPIGNWATFRLYSINAIYSTDPLVYNYNRDFILSLKKYSTLISESAEMQRIQYFNKQREIIQSLTETT
ncbi:hypothetical protein [Massilibacteroides sp.]|uniref:hypothetical protein n=1 Tax=Massilibacteroides sp. TaxID=2034766 RepID=UPI00261C8B38|nr:hypothetical protein [Massilibacteroides sp.]MDD4515084.1 hypothetical protein [Massilibacteroides sp.]